MTGRRVDRPTARPQKKYQLMWLGKKWTIELFQNDSINFYWIWRSYETHDELRATIPIVRGRPVISGAQLMFAALIYKLRGVNHVNA